MRTVTTFWHFGPFLFKVVTTYFVTWGHTIVTHVTTTRVA